MRGRTFPRPSFREAVFHHCAMAELTFSLYFTIEKCHGVASTQTGLAEKLAGEKKRH